MENLLYRGINCEMFELLKSKRVLEPKGDKFTHTLQFNGDFKFDGSFTFGESKQNAVVGHQKDSNKYKTSGISTTPHWHRAVFYALCNLKFSSGYILVFNREIVIEKGVEFITVNERIKSPEIPEDEEVIMRAIDDQPISIDFITSIERIDRTVISL